MTFHDIVIYLTLYNYLRSRPQTAFTPLQVRLTLRQLSCFHALVSFSEASETNIEKWSKWVFLFDGE